MSKINFFYYNNKLKRLNSYKAILEILVMLNIPNFMLILRNYSINIGFQKEAAGI